MAHLVIEYFSISGPWMETKYRQLDQYLGVYGNYGMQDLGRHIYVFSTWSLRSVTGTRIPSSGISGRLHRRIINSSQDDRISRHRAMYGASRSKDPTPDVQMLRGWFLFLFPGGPENTRK